MNSWRWICILMLVVILGVGCTRLSRLDDEAPDVQIVVNLDPDPPLLGRPCRVVVTILAADGEPIDDARVEIKGDMTHAGMVPVVVTVTESVEGVYSTFFEWTMAGDWVLTVRAELHDGRVARRQFEVAVGVPGE